MNKRSAGSVNKAGAQFTAPRRDERVQRSLSKLLPELNAQNLTAPAPKLELTAVPAIDSVLAVWRGQPVTRKQFLYHLQQQTAACRMLSAKTCAVHLNNRYEFIVNFLAVLQAGKDVCLLANLLPDTLRELNAELALITEQKLGKIRAQVFYSPLSQPTAQSGTQNATEPNREFGAHSEQAAATQINLEQQEQQEHDLRTLLKSERLGGSIYFQTSGSSGDTKIIQKQLTQLTEETDELEYLFGFNDLIDAPSKNIIHVSSVSHQHIYGFLFNCWWPLLHGHQLTDVHLDGPESLLHYCQTIDQSGARSITKRSSRSAQTVLRVAASPGFWKRFASLYQDRQWRSSVELQLFSSGGHLIRTIANAVGQISEQHIIEILGSTETGGVAYRRSPQNTDWTPFPRVSVKTDVQQQLWVSSPFVDALIPHTAIPMGDCAVIHSTGAFTLQQRIDRIVKIEGKRISLGKIEAALLRHPYIEQAICLKREGRREYIGAVVVLSKMGQYYETQHCARKLHQVLHQYLAESIDGVGLPRKWRHCSSLPLNQQGKTTIAELQQLFVSSRL